VKNWTIIDWGKLAGAAYLGAAVGATIARALLTGVLP
jgi:hypothetical protein